MQQFWTVKSRIRTDEQRNDQRCIYQKNALEETFGRMISQEHEKLDLKKSSINTIVVQGEFHPFVFVSSIGSSRALICGIYPRCSWRNLILIQISEVHGSQLLPPRRALKFRFESPLYFWPLETVKVTYRTGDC